MRSWHEHYSKAFPGGKVVSSENNLDVFCKEGKHHVSLEKGGDGVTRCVSKEKGCVATHAELSGDLDKKAPKKA